MIRTFSPLLIPLLIGAILLGCSASEQETNDKYTATINAWHQQRIESLKQKDSWLSLAGLYQLNEGPHSFGSDSTNDLVFPPKAPARIGTITRNGQRFVFDIADGVQVLHDSSEVSQIEMSLTNQNESTELRHGALLWYIIERRGEYYIRLKDTEHPNFTNFDGINRFPVSRDWRIKATFNPFVEPRTITIPDILGDTYQDSLYGMLEFSIDGSSIAWRLSDILTRIKNSLSSLATKPMEKVLTAADVIFTLPHRMKTELPTLTSIKPIIRRACLQILPPVPCRRNKIDWI